MKFVNQRATLTCGDGRLASENGTSSDHDLWLCASVSHDSSLSIGWAKLHVFKVREDPHFSNDIRLVIASAKIQSVSNHLQMSVASPVFGASSANIGSSKVTPGRLRIASN